MSIALTFAMAFNFAGCTEETGEQVTEKAVKSGGSLSEELTSQVKQYFGQDRRQKIYGDPIGTLHKAFHKSGGGQKKRKRFYFSFVPAPCPFHGGRRRR